MFDFINFLILGLLISLPVGPTTILSFQRVIKSGFKAGVATGLGLVFADVVHSTLTISGLPILQNIIDNYSGVLKVAGFIIIIIIAITTYRSKLEIENEDKLRDKNLFKYFFEIFFYAIVHPASLILFLSINASGLVTNENKILFPFGILIGELIFVLSINWIFKKFKDRISPKHFSSINKVTAFILVGLSLFLLLK